MTKLDWGEVPDRNLFVELTMDHFPFPMELPAGYDFDVVKAAINQGIDSYLEAVFFDQEVIKCITGNKIKITIKDPGSMHTLIRRLVEMGTDTSLDFANSLLNVLEFEWV